MTPEAVHTLNAWLIILPAVAVGYTLGRVRPLRFIACWYREWINLNDILASAERLGRRDRITSAAGKARGKAATNGVTQRSEHSAG